MTSIVSAITPVGEADLRAPRAAASLLSSGMRMAADGISAALAIFLIAAVRGSVSVYAEIALIVSWVVSMAIAGRPAPSARGWTMNRATLRGAALAGVLGWGATTLLGGSAEVFTFTVLATAFTLVARPAATPGRIATRTLVLAESAEGLETAAGLYESSHGRLVPVAACRPGELEDALERVRPELVLALPSSELGGRQLQRLTWQVEAAGVPLAVSTRLADVSTARTTVERVGTLGVLHLVPARRRGAGGLMKTLWERCAAAGLVVVLAPVLLAVSVLVRLDSPGAVLFRQERVGRDGRSFTMLKFRTMYVDAEARLAELRDRDEADGLLFKMRHDPRVTRIGRLLRKYSLDELPQLFNVIRGDMALVGPRPALPREVAAYDGDPLHRLVVKPGITGLWQVSGRSDLSWEESVRLDLDYVDNWSIGRDLMILMRTVGAVVSHRGAY